MSGPRTFTKNSGSAHAPAVPPRTGAESVTTRVSTTAIGASTPKTAVRPLIFTSYERVLSSHVIVPSRAAIASFTRRNVLPSRSSAWSGAGGLPSRASVAPSGAAGGAPNEGRGQRRGDEEGEEPGRRARHPRIMATPDLFRAGADLLSSRVTVGGVPVSTGHSAIEEHAEHGRSLVKTTVKN